MQRLIIHGGTPLRGHIRVSGSKNATLPLMAAALLGSTTTTLRNVPVLRDIEMMADVLRSLGADVDFTGHTLTINPAGFSKVEAPYDMVRKMRASIYVMGPMLARLGRARVSLPGGCAIGPRPIDLHLRGFEKLGAEISQQHGYIVAESPKLQGCEFNLSGAAGSSVGATCNVVMAAALAGGETTIHGAAREPDVCELANFLNKMGAQVEGAGGRTIRVQGVDELHGIDHHVVSDRIEAGTFMTAAAITGGDIILTHCPLEHMEATVSKLLEIGVTVEKVEAGVRVTGNLADYEPTNIQTAPYPGFPTDMQAQFMALLTLVPGISTIREGIYVDRFMHASELVRMGADIRVLQGTATITGVEKLWGAPVMASDLRASAALVVAALAAEGDTEINRIYHIDRGYEYLEKKLSRVGAKIMRISDREPEQIIVAGGE